MKEPAAAHSDDGPRSSALTDLAALQRRNAELEAENSRLRAEEQLRKANDRLEAALTSAEVGIWTWDIPTNIVVGDVSMAFLFGLDERELAEGRPPDTYIERIHPDDQPSVREKLAEALAQGGPFAIEFRVFSADGKVRWVAARGRVKMDDDHQPQSLKGAVLVITDRKLAEKRLRESEERFRAAVEANSSLLWTNNARGEMEGEQQAWGGFTGQSYDEYQGYGWSKAVYPEDAQPTIDAWNLAVMERRMFVFEHRVRRHDGAWRLFSIRAVPLLDERGAIREWVGVHNDITEKKQAEEELRESVARFLFIAESMPQKIFTATASGEVDYFNQQWTQFTGLSFEEIRGWGWTQFIHPDDVEENLRIWQRSTETGEPFQLVHRLRRSDGVYRWHLSRAHAMRNADGKVSMWIGSTTEIHDERETQEALRRANADLEQFAYSASHDLQEPLRNVSIYSELLAKRYKDRLEGEGLEFLDYLKNGASRMEMLIRGLLSYTHITSLTEDLPEEITDANGVFLGVTAGLAAAIRDSGAQVTADSLPSIAVRSVHLQQLIQNLIGNAIKYRSRAEPRIHLAAKKRGAQWLFSVRDNGIGIKPEYREQIFGLFKRLHAGDEYPGTGIGLAICQRIVERYGGRIWVESEPANGSTFYFTLPV